MLRMRNPTFNLTFHLTQVFLFGIQNYLHPHPKERKNKQTRAGGRFSGSTVIHIIQQQRLLSIHFILFPSILLSPGWLKHLFGRGARI